METKIDPWLYPGCPCEVWSGSERHILLYYIYSASNNNYFGSHYNSEKRFCIHKKHYHPISTPWGFASKRATGIQIDNEGVCIFRKDSDIEKGYIPLYTDDCGNKYFYLPWPSCPENLRDHIWPRPEWAKV